MLQRTFQAQVKRASAKFWRLWKLSNGDPDRWGFGPRIARWCESITRRSRDPAEAFQVIYAAMAAACERHARQVFPVRAQPTHRTTRRTSPCPPPFVPRLHPRPRRLWRRQSRGPPTGDPYPKSNTARFLLPTRPGRKAGNPSPGFPWIPQIVKFPKRKFFGSLSCARNFPACAQALVTTRYSAEAAVPAGNRQFLFAASPSPPTSPGGSPWRAAPRPAQGTKP